MQIFSKFVSTLIIIVILVVAFSGSIFYIKLGEKIRNTYIKEVVTNSISGKKEMVYIYEK